MAKEDAQTTTFAARQVERTFRFDGSVPRNGAPSVAIYREKFWQTEAGEIIGTPIVSSYHVDWSAIQDKAWVLSDGETVTAQQIFEALALAFDELAVPPAPVEEPLPEQPEEPADGQTD